MVKTPCVHPLALLNGALSSSFLLVSVSTKALSLFVSPMLSYYRDGGTAMDVDTFSFKASL